MKEQRQAQRVPWVTSVECDEVETGRLHRGAQLSDISLTGVFVEGLPMFPEGTRLRLRFTLPSLQMEICGNVVHATPRRGMGLLFDHLTPVHRVVIQELMRPGLEASEAPEPGTSESEAHDPEPDDSIECDFPAEALSDPGAGLEAAAEIPPAPDATDSWLPDLPPLPEPSVRSAPSGTTSPERSTATEPSEALEREPDHQAPEPPLPETPVLDPPVLDPPVLDPPVLDPPPLDPPPRETLPRETLPLETFPSEVSSPPRTEELSDPASPRSAERSDTRRILPPGATAPPRPPPDDGAPTPAGTDPSPPAVEKGEGEPRPRVLVVDDHDRTRTMLRGMIEGRKKAFDVTEARDGEDCLRVVEEQEQFDLIFLDVDMPRMDGFRTCRELRERGVRSPIIFLTGRSEIGDFRAGHEAGADTYIKKPIVLGTLRSMLGLFTSGSLQRR